MRTTYCFVFIVVGLLGCEKRSGSPVTRNTVAQAEWKAPEAADIVGQEDAVLTDAPFVPPPITRKHPTKVVVRLEVREVVREIAEGVDYTFWTFGGHVPGKFIRIRQGDVVELHLANHPDSKVPHNIDLHAVTGPGGGAVSSLTPPGHETVFSFQALNPGLYIYGSSGISVGVGES